MQRHRGSVQVWHSIYSVTSSSGARCRREHFETPHLVYDVLALVIMLCLVYRIPYIVAVVVVEW